MTNGQVIMSPIAGLKQSIFTITPKNSIVVSISPNSANLIICMQYKTRND
jgi:hypothetical protein